MSGNQSLTVGNWLAISGLVLGVLGIAGALSLRVYATRDDCLGGEHRLETRIIVTEQQNQHQTQEMTRLNVQVENIDTRQQTDSRNIEKLLERFRVRPEPAPTMKAVPAARPLAPTP